MAYNCPVCNKSFGKSKITKHHGEEIKIGPKELLIDHIVDRHPNQIPKDMDVYQFLYYSRTGDRSGPCMVCGNQTEWNYDNGKPFKVCEDENCVKKLAKSADKNHKKVHGKSRGEILSDPHYQNDTMLGNQKRAKIYRFKDGGENITLSRLEYEGDEHFDKVLGFTSKMVIECPYHFKYKDKGKLRHYLPDRYLPDYNLIVEYKEGGDNPNTNPAYIKETKYKQKLKAEAVKKDGRFHYIIIEDSNFEPLLELLDKIKREGSHKKNSKKKKHYVLNESAVKLAEIPEEGENMFMQLVTFHLKGTGDIAEICIVDDPQSKKMMPLKGDTINFIDMDTQEYIDNYTVKVYNIAPHGSMNISDFWKIILTLMKESNKKVEAVYGFIMDLLSFYNIGIHINDVFTNNQEAIMDFGIVFEGKSITDYLWYINQKKETLNEQALMKLLNI